MLILNLGVTVFDSNSDKGGPPFSFFDLLENIKHEILMYNELQNENIKEVLFKKSLMREDKVSIYLQYKK